MNRFEAEVVDVRLESREAGRQRWQVLLTETGFSAARSQGRLEAVARSGARLEVPVLQVVLDDGEVWHAVEKPLAAGTAVVGFVEEDEGQAG